MNETYVVYLNREHGFFESYRKGDPEGDCFTSPDIGDAKQFHSHDDALNFCEEHFGDYAVLRWM